MLSSGFYAFCLWRYAEMDSGQHHFLVYDPTYANNSWQPVFLWAWFELPIFWENGMRLLDWAFKAALLACVFRIRFSRWIAFVLALYLLGLRQCYGMTNNLDGLICVLMFALCFRGKL